MINDNIKRIKENIDKIKSTNKIDYDIELMAVTKTHPVSCVMEALKSGVTLFGENRILEAGEKFKSDILKNLTYDLHIIGHLQRNKVKDAVEIASMIQSIDRIETLDVLEEMSSKKNKKMDFLIEINTSNEPQKYGIEPGTIEDFLNRINQKAYGFCNLRGLMTVGPLTDDKNKIRNSFKLLKNIFERTKSSLKKKDFDVLSMGMSLDYEIAIGEGSNLVRIGSLIFGNRG
jgi:PLP dependent protein